MNRFKIFFSSLFLSGIFILMFSGMAFASDLTINANQTLSADQTVDGNLILDHATLNLDDHQLTVNGDLVMCAGEDYVEDTLLDIAGGTLNVTGSLILETGELKANSGNIHVGGDFRVQSRTLSGGSYVYGTSKGWLTMESPGGTINVDHDFFIDSINFGYLDAGTMNVKGNFTQKSSTSDSREDSFNATEGHKVVLCGTGEQDVSFDDPTESGFGMLDVTNGTTRDIVFKTPVRGWTLNQDLKVTGDLSLADKQMSLNKHNLTVTGDVIVNSNYEGALDIADGTLEVSGSLIHQDGELKADSGKIQIDGDFRIQLRATSGGNYVYGAGKGWLTMGTPGGTINVDGSFFIDSISFSYLDAGTMNIKGNFTQQSSISDSRADSFQATEGHKVALCGTGEQDVSFDDPTESCFGTLEINNSTSNVKFLTDYTCLKIINNGTAVITDFTANPSSAAIITGKTQAIKVTVTYDNGTSQDVTKSPLTTWESEDTDVATVSGGVITGESKGETVVTVSYGGQSIEIPVKVAPVVKSISADSTTLNMEVGGDDVTPPVIMAYYKGNDEDEDVTELVAWTSNKPEIVNIVNSDEGVMFHAKAKGVAKLTATYCGKKTVINVKVTSEVTGLEACPSTVILTTGKKQAVKVYVDYADGSKEDITKSKSATWESADTDVATVSKNSIKGIGKGETTITVSYNDQSIDIPVNVTPVVKSISADPADTIEMIVGDEADSPAIIAHYAGVGEDEDVTELTTWKSSKPQIVEVVNGDDGVTFKAKAKGKAKITAAYSKKKTTVTVIVS